MNQKIICYDADLNVEAYSFTGVSQNFPNHFHDYYVVGLIEEGERRLVVNGKEYVLVPGDLITFNPYDNHSCEGVDGERLTYLCINIKKELFQPFTGNELPKFLTPMQEQTSVAEDYRRLHDAIMKQGEKEERETLFLLFLEELLRYTQKIPVATTEEQETIAQVCGYLETHYDQKITLDQLCKVVHLNKHSLVRQFTKEKGITPYRYLETFRIVKAKELLEQGCSLTETADRTGFYDQSHFTNYFSRFIGLTPNQYRTIFEKRNEE
ncbi:helix-turn-helix domain-containing protein [Enterococcus sp. DIV0170]|uniref:helix-turn-helix domain-containing protein n=1 Tax=Enterococcus sp. DIV0170 TaxID=2774642 RepID=UPI003F270D4D